MLPEAGPTPLGRLRRDRAGHHDSPLLEKHVLGRPSASGARAVQVRCGRRTRRRRGSGHTPPAAARASVAGSGAGTMADRTVGGEGHGIARLFRGLVGGDGGFTNGRTRRAVSLLTRPGGGGGTVDKSGRDGRTAERGELTVDRRTVQRQTGTAGRQTGERLLRPRLRQGFGGRGRLRSPGARLPSRRRGRVASHEPRRTTDGHGGTRSPSYSALRSGPKGYEGRVGSRLNGPGGGGDVASGVPRVRTRGTSTGDGGRAKGTASPGGAGGLLAAGGR